jgi:hypothetical protein
MAGHQKTVGSCGHVMIQCRCPGPHTEHRLPIPCRACAATTGIIPPPGPVEMAVTTTGIFPQTGYCNRCQHGTVGLHVCPALPAPSRTPHKCPVCEGRGRVDRSFYGDTMNASKYLVCQSCHGTGVVWS